MKFQTTLADISLGIEAISGTQISRKGAPHWSLQFLIQVELSTELGECIGLEVQASVDERSNCLKIVCGHLVPLKIPKPSFARTANCTNAKVPQEAERDAGECVGPVLHPVFPVQFVVCQTQIAVVDTSAEVSCKPPG